MELKKGEEPMCEHKNLRTVGHRLFCKDCKAELPIEFLTKDEKPADVVIDAAAIKIEPAEVMEEQTVIEPADVAPKKGRAKTGRKTGKNGGV